MNSYENEFWTFIQTVAWAASRSPELVSEVGDESDSLRSLAQIFAAVPGKYGRTVEQVIGEARAGRITIRGRPNELFALEVIQAGELLSLTFFCGETKSDYLGPETGSRGKCWYCPIIAKSEARKIWKQYEAFEVHPLDPIGDDELASRVNLPHWTLTEAFFLLSGHKPPGYESARQLQDHFLSAYGIAVRAIEMGGICRKIERDGEKLFVESPANWFSWANKIEPKNFKVDDRVRLYMELSDAVLSPPETHSGLPGRPSAKQTYEKEFARRVEAGENLEDSVVSQAEVLHEWFKSEHPNLAAGSRRTVENNIRTAYRKAKSESQNPRK